MKLLKTHLMGAMTTVITAFICHLLDQEIQMDTVIILYAVYTTQYMIFDKRRIK